VGTVLHEGVDDGTEGFQCVLLEDKVKAAPSQSYTDDLRACWEVHKSKERLEAAKFVFLLAMGTMKHDGLVVSHAVAPKGK
jgi:hypothetical protein